MLLEHLAPLHRRLLIIHGPQEQILDNTAAKRDKLLILALSYHPLNDSLGLTKLIESR